MAKDAAHYSLFGYRIVVLPQSADAACDAEVADINAAAEASDINTAASDPSPPSALTRAISPNETAAASSSLAPSSDMRAISMSPDEVTAAADLDSSSDSGPTKPKKRPRSEIRSIAALALAPRFKQDANIDD